MFIQKPQAKHMIKYLPSFLESTPYRLENLYQGIVHGNFALHGRFIFNQLWINEIVSLKEKSALFLVLHAYPSTKKKKQNIHKTQSSKCLI